MAKTNLLRRLTFAFSAAWWQHRLVVPALLLVTFMLGLCAWQFNLTADTTHNHRNTLSAPSIQVLKQLPDRIEITAFCSNSPYKGRYFRKSITALIQRYQHLHPNLQLQFVDPATAPTMAREWQIKKEGEMVIRYRDQQQHLYLPYTEEAFTNVLLQLQHGARAPLIFTTGNGEPALQDTTSQGASQLGQALQAAGLRTSSTASLHQPDKEAPLSDKQASLATLVLAGATQPYSAAQRTAIQAHIQQGGNLVWLVDHPQQQGLDALATQLGLTISQGMIIDPVNRQFEIPLHALSTQRYAAQGPTQDFALRTFFDNAHAIQRPRQAGEPWRVLPLVAVAEHGWVSASYQPAHSATLPVFNPQTDTQGPATVMLALEKDRASGERQRIVIIGSQQFFTNAQLQRGGNLALTMQSLQWVVNNQPSVSLPVSPLRDSVIALPATQTWLMVLFNSFQFGLPALLLWAGWQSWRRKQRY
jgi:hypothetical protein